MLSIPAGAQVFLCASPIDLRRSFDGLCAAVALVFERDVFDGHLFLFLNKRRDALERQTKRRAERRRLKPLTDELTDEQKADLLSRAKAKILGDRQKRAARRKPPAPPQPKDA